MSEQSHLSGQQVSAIQKASEAALARVIRDIELRKFSLSEAARVTEAALRADPKDTIDVIKLAESIHAFLTAPGAEVSVKIEPQAQ